MIFVERAPQLSPECRNQRLRTYYLWKLERADVSPVAIGDLMNGLDRHFQKIEPLDRRHGENLYKLRVLTLFATPLEKPLIEHEVKTFWKKMREVFAADESLYSKERWEKFREVLTLLETRELPKPPKT